MAWRGFVARGAPEPAMAYFEPAAKPEEMIALAWYLENGSHTFYATLAAEETEDEVANTYKELARAEGRHRASLIDLYRQMSGESADASFPKSIIEADEDDDVMEGGMRVSEALTWARGRKAAEVLELSIALEANSLDLYLLMENRTRSQETGRVFKVLAAEEKEHLEHLSALLGKSR